MTDRLLTDYIRDILDAIDKAAQFAPGDDFDSFVADSKTIFAVVRALEIIGEAAKQIPDGIRAKYSDVPWREMTGMRDKLTHEYFGMKLDTVWKTLKQDLPALRPLMAQMLADLAAVQSGDNT